MKNSSLTLRVTILYCMSRYGNELAVLSRVKVALTN